MPVKLKAHIYENIVRILFLIMIPLLLLQLYVARKYSEPYPAIIYPAFEGTSKNSEYNKYIETEIFVYFNDGEKYRLDERKFLGEIPYKFRKNLLKNYFLNRPIENGKEGNAYREFTNFLESRLTKMFKNKKPQSISISWYQYKQYFREKPVRLEKTLLKSGLIEFDQN